MSVSKKRAAPKPPVPSTLAGPNKENEITSENGKEASKGKISDELVTLKVVHPDQSVEEIRIAPGTPLIDLRTQLCAKYKISAGSYKLEPVDGDGRSIPFTPSSTVGSTAASAVHLKTKAKEPVKVAPPKVVEQTVRLTIKMSPSNQQVLRVRPSVALSKLMPQILEKTGVKQESHKHLELRHPEQKSMALDTSRSLNDYKIKEIFVADKRVHTESSETETSSLHSPEKAPKVSRGGSEKRSKKIKRFFGISKKHKSSSASSDDAVSPTTSPPQIPQAIVEELANSNGNNSAEREKTAKKHRPAPQPDQESKPLQGQVSEKIEEAKKDVEKEEKMEMEETVEEEEVKEVPSSPPPRPTAPPRAKPRAPVAAARVSTTGKKRAPPPPTMASSPPPKSPSESGSPSPKSKQSRPEKPPRRQSVERQKEQPEVNVEMETEEDVPAENEDIPIEKVETPPVEKRESVEVHAQDDDEENGDKAEISVTEEEETPKMEVQSTPQEIEEPPSPRDSVESLHEDVPDGESHKEEDAHADDNPPVLEMTQQEKEPHPEEWIIVTDKEVEEIRENMQEEEISDMPIVDAPHEEEPAAHEDLQQKPIESEEEEVSEEEKEAVEFVVPLVKESKDPEPIIEATQPEMENAPPEVEDMMEHHTMAHHDSGYKPEVLITEDDLQEVPPDPQFEETPLPSPPPVEEEPVLPPPVEEEPVLPPPVEEEPVFSPPVEKEPVLPPPVEEETDLPPPVEEDPFLPPPVEKDPVLPSPVEKEPVPPPPMEEPGSALQDEDNLFTTPQDFDIYDSKKEDFATAEAKALEMIKQFTLAESLPQEAPKAVSVEKPLSPRLKANQNVSPTPAVEHKADVTEELEEESEEETKRKIEDLQEQINLMRQKKAQKEAAEEFARKNPYTKIPEPKPVVEGLPNSRMKTIKFVPNQRQRVYEDYEAAPEVAISLSQGGEIKGVGIVTEKKTENRSPEAISPPAEQQAPPVLEEIKIPETVVIKEKDKPAPVFETEKPLPASTQPKPTPKPVETTPMPAESVPKLADSTPKPTAKPLGGYVNSAMLKQVVAKATAPKTYTSASYDERKSALPNYYRRFLGKEAISAAETEEPAKTSAEKVIPNGNVTVPKSPPPKSPPPITSVKPPIPQKPKSPTVIQRPPKSPRLAQTVNSILDPPAESLPAPPEETYSVDPVGSKLNDAPLPPPPEEFLTPREDKDTPDLPLNIPSNEEKPASPTDAMSPKRATSPAYSPLSPNFVGISSAKPFGAKTGSSGPKFRPMSAAFKSGKGKANSP